MKQTVILMTPNNDVVSVLYVENMDDNFYDALSKAEYDWNTTEKGKGTNYDVFVLKSLVSQGYHVQGEGNFAVYQTCL